LSWTSASFRLPLEPVAYGEKVHSVFWSDEEGPVVIQE
jgi:hypothetical protein